jgi:hypothetical protein
MAMHNLTQLDYHVRTVIYVSDADGKDIPVRFPGAAQGLPEKVRGSAENGSALFRCYIACHPASVHNIAQNLKCVRRSICKVRIFATVRLELLAFYRSSVFAMRQPSAT